MGAAPRVLTRSPVIQEVEVMGGGAEAQVGAREENAKSGRSVKDGWSRCRVNGGEEAATGDPSANLAQRKGAGESLGY